jgi:adenylyltransferase/sulfurtransferase
MATTVFIPTPLRAFTDQQATVQVSGSNVGEVLQNLVSVHAELRHHLFTPDGKLRSFVNVYVNDEDIRYLTKEQTPVGDKDSVSIVPSVAGGAPDTGVLNNDEVRPWN